MQTHSKQTHSKTGLAKTGLAKIGLAGVVAFAAFGIPQTAQAAEPANHEYDFVEVDFVDYDNLDGPAIIGSFELNQNVYLKAAYEQLDADGFSSAELETFELGGGYAFPVSPGTDLHVGAAYVEQEFGAFDDDGFQVDGGIRAQVTDLVELYGDVRHRDMGDSDENLLGAGVRFNMTPAFKVSAGFEDADDYDGLRLGARYEF